MSIDLTGLPSLEWTHGPGGAEHGDDRLVLTAAAGTDWSNDATRDGAPAEPLSTSLSFAPGHGDFLLSARVEVNPPRTTFDAAVLTVWADDRHWAKLCFEQSPQGEAMVVSVVTDEFSDDANGAPVEGSAVWLRIARVGSAFAFHSSLDGAFWRFARLFRLDLHGDPRVGFMAQAPNGDRAEAVFSHVSFERRTLKDLRNGE
ncbi:DUF1349 domain-containing protein [Microbacterium sp. KRD172]|uniref:DUF1349 domain-containing protein n=1 Tax=Microbacterium sp. KRD172 TaxID=2729727 RepID=UPI0019D166D1|nr:DUF1349 domain-containing protein [Microbacterium sp. KRD172]